LIPLFGPVGAKLLHWADALLAALMLVYFGRTHFHSVNVGLFAALIFVSTPAVAWSAGTASNDLPAAFLTLLVLHSFLRWREHQGRRSWLILGGFLGGYSVGVKPFGAVTVGLFAAGIGLTILWEQRWSGVRAAVSGIAVIGAAAILACVPWMLHTFLLTGDPVFPFLYKVFRTPYWDTHADNYVHGTSRYYGSDWSLRGFLTLPWRLTIHGDQYRTLIGAGFLASAPLVLMSLLATRSRYSTLFRYLAAFLVAWTAAWFATGLIEFRYAESMVAVVAVLISASLLGPRELRAPVLPIRVFGLAFTLAAVAMNSQFLLPLQRHAAEPLQESRANFAWTYLYEGKPLRQTAPMSGWPPIVWYLDDHLPASGTKVYDACPLNPLVQFYAYIDVELFNGASADGPAYANGGWKWTDPDAYRRMRDAGVTHVAFCSYQEPQVRKSSLWPHLRSIPGAPADLYALRGS
jgi:hypothetical protein